MDLKMTLLLTLLFAGFAGTQELPTNDALRKAIALSELEHDDAGARAAMIELAEDSSVPMGVKRHAWLHIARLSRRMGEEKMARIVLERAARGNDELARRAQEMLEQEPQDPAREKELQERAEVALRNWIQAGHALRDLVWFGDTAATLLVREYERLRADLKTQVNWERTGRAVAALWQVDSDVARGFLAEQLRMPEAEERRVALLSMHSRWNVPAAHLPLIRTALADADAEVVIAALSKWQQLEIDDLAPKIADPRVTVRLAALNSLRQWTNNRFVTGVHRDGPERRAESRMIAQHLPVPLAATDPAEFRLAASLLCTTAATSSIEGRTLLARWLTKLGDDGAYSRWPEDVEFAGPNENAEIIRAAFEELGPVVENAVRGSQQAASSLYWGYRQNWDRGALDAVITGARLGYGQLDWQWLDQHALPEDAPRIVEATADSPGFDHIIGWLASRDVPEACFEVMRRIADERMEGGESDNPTAQLLIAIGRTGHPDAAPYLLEVAGRPNGNGLLATLSALVFAGHRRNDQPTRNAMRAALLAIEPQGNGDLEMRAAQLFGQLVRMGDVGVFDDPDAVQAKIAEQWTRVGGLPGAEELWERYRVGPVLGNWLTTSRQSNGAIDWWHGYSGEVLTRLWRRLLAPRADGGWRRDWEAVETLLRFVPENPNGISRELVLVLCDAFTARCESDHRLRDELILSALHKLVAPATRVPWRDDAEVLAGIDALRASLWTAPASSVREVAARSAELPLDEVRRARLVRLLADSELEVARAAWDRLHHEADLPVDAEQVVSGLSSPSADVRRRALEFASTAPAGLGDAVKPALADSSRTIRSLACQVLGATLRLDVVPDLLVALKDSDSEVRLAARNALQSIRFYHDEKAHWDRVFAGKAGLTAASAAEALLDQARPGNDTDTRILAIRSLGVLAAPETLPFLIEWTKDEDAKVSTAAREAIGAIHTRSR